MIITNKEAIRYDYSNDCLVIDDEYLVDEDRYSILDRKEPLGMKALGRIYFHSYSNLDYTTGEPVEKAVISGGERGVEGKYLKHGVRVYTEEQVKTIILKGLYEDNEELNPKLPNDVWALLEELSNNKAKNKSKRAKDILQKYSKIDFRTGEKDSESRRY
jgi:hypothetical protein